MAMRLVALVSLLALSGSIGISARNDKGIKRELPSSLNDDDDKDITNRVGEHPRCCSTDDIYIEQGLAEVLPSGAKSYSVDIISICDIFNLKLNCGSFSSAIVIDPKVFRRITNNLCLVNDGGVLRAGEDASFSYANYSPYPLSVSSFECS